MERKRLVEFPLEDGSTIVMEVEAGADDGTIKRAARAGEVAERAGRTLESALDRVKPATEALLKRLTGLTTRPDEIEVEFGLKISAQAGAFIASGTVEANYVVKLKWSPGKNKEE